MMEIANNIIDQEDMLAVLPDDPAPPENRERRKLDLALTWLISILES